MKKLIPVMLLVFIVMLSGCSRNTGGKQSETGAGNQTGNSGNAGGSASVGSSTGNTSKLFSSRDFEVGYDENASAVILLEGDTITSNSNAATVSGRTVTITDEGTYILSGNLNDGMIIVNADKTDKIQLVFNNVSIHSETSAPVYILNADKVL